MVLYLCLLHLGSLYQWQAHPLAVTLETALPPSGTRWPWTYRPSSPTNLSPIKMASSSPLYHSGCRHSIKISWSSAMCLDAPLWLLYQVPSSHWLHKPKYRFLRGRDFFTLSPSSNSLMVQPTFSPDLPVGRYYLNQIRSTLTSSPSFPFHQHISATFSPVDDPDHSPRIHGITSELFTGLAPPFVNSTTNLATRSNMALLPPPPSSPQLSGFNTSGPPSMLYGTPTGLLPLRTVLFAPPPLSPRSSASSPPSTPPHRLLANDIFDGRSKK
ncbi:hypothetical protein BCR42DRAFT_444135 [Absidia repens]|uniref:Uncharacterized protein n=1 Tax=Absidia repens TaxID=90262 RepID=A0A1X2HXI2_9FUNG|nr:hypothetical protein BCR42DRAFT_444135 [Absidia repens]